MNAWQAFQCALRSVLADKGAVVPAVLGVVVYCFFYPLPYLPEVVQHVPVVVADYDASPLSRQFERDLDTTREVTVTGVVRRVEDAVPLLQQGDIGGIVAIPRDFRRDVLRGTPTGVTVMGNGGYIVVDGTILGTAAQVLESTVAAPLAAHVIEAYAPPAIVSRAAHAGPLLIKQPLFNTVAGYESYVVPASMGLIVHQLLVISICLVLGTWIERGRWPVAPTGRLSIGAFTGMLSAFWLLVWCAILFWIGFVFWYHDLPRAGNLGAAIIVGALYAPEPEPFFLLLQKLQGLFQFRHRTVKRGSKKIHGQGPGLAGEYGSHPNAILPVLIHFDRALVFIAMICLRRHLAPPTSISFAF